MILTPRRSLHLNSWQLVASSVCDWRCEVHVHPHCQHIPHCRQLSKGASAKNEEGPIKQENQIVWVEGLEDTHHFGSGFVRKWRQLASGQDYYHTLACSNAQARTGMNLRSGAVVGAHILRPEHRPAFEEGVRQLFLRWTALCLAVENHWGGASSKEKASSLMQEIVEWFYRKKEHYADELEELLDDAMLHDFNVEAEDGSPRQVAEALVLIYTECFQGNYSSVHRMQAQAATGAAKSRRQVVDSDGTLMGEDSGGTDSSSDDDEEGDEDEDEDMEDVAAPADPPSKPTGPVVDDEGFTVVQRKGKR